MTVHIPTALGENPQTNEDHYASRPLSQPFHGRRFKVLRVAGNSLQSIIMSIYFKAISLIYWIVCQKSHAQHYRDLASYHGGRILQRPIAYVLYGNKIVNFSINSTGTPRVIKKQNSDEIKELKEIYGDLFDEMRKRVSSSRIPIDEQKLSQCPINEGICLGASLDFISRYLKDDSETSFEAIEKISLLFSQKGTSEAQITQILYKSQNLQTLLKEKSSRCSDLEEKLVQETEEQKNYFAEQFNDLKKLKNKEFLPEKLAQIQLDAKSKIQEMTDEMNRQIAKQDTELQIERLQCLANAHYLKLKANTIILDEDIQQKIPPELFHQRILDLPEGAYLTCLSCSPDSPAGHAIAFIKASDGKCYLFDPNLATLRFDSPEEFPSELWKLTKEFYNKKGACKVTVYDCVLNN